MGTSEPAGQFRTPAGGARRCNTGGPHRPSRFRLWRDLQRSGDIRRAWGLLGGFAPVGAVAVVLLLDGLSGTRAWPVPVLGLLDEPAHLLTAALLTAAVPWAEIRRGWRWILMGSVLIDLDHVPLYTFAGDFSVGGRPPTHSLVTVLALLVAALAIPRARWPLIGLAGGCVLHFVRDLATGPGVALLWPIFQTPLRVQYPAHIALIALAAVWVSVKDVDRFCGGKAYP